MACELSRFSWHGLKLKTSHFSPDCWGFAFLAIAGTRKPLPHLSALAPPLEDLVTELDFLPRASGLGWGCLELEPGSGNL